MSIYSSFLKLKSYCEKEQFKGWDPYDGLNSKAFKALPFKHWDLARLAWIQGFKRSPINFRKLLGVPKEYNAKGIGLFLNGYCNLYRIAEKGDVTFGTKEALLKQINELASLLISLQTKGYSGACWGYNFDWQSRAFFLPNKTPTVVATSFVVDALLKAYECTKNETYKKIAESSSNFVLNDLNRIPKQDGLYMFSYSPLDYRAVYNATLLGSKLLSKIYHYTRDEKLKEAAFMSAKAVCLIQKENGAFPHSDQVGDRWRDSFHTGFKIESLAVYSKFCEDSSFDSNIELGIKYWIENFFMSDGTAKYYDNKIYPIDLHCTAQMLPTLYNSNRLMKYQDQTEKVLSWSIKNMQNKKQGYFYFQRTKQFLNKTAYIRWPNAWMFYSMSFWFLFKTDYDKN
jgi:hypothetical protein